MAAIRESPFCPQCGQPTHLEERFGRPRPVCAACGHVVYFDPKVAVVAFVTRGEAGEETNWLLLVQRAHDPAAGSWALPAGFVDPDEPPAAAAERETWEETGLLVQATSLIALLHRPDPEGLADIVLAYRAHVVGGALQAGDDAAQAGWFHRDHLPPIALATTRLLVASWGEQVVGGGL